METETPRSPRRRILIAVAAVALVGIAGAMALPRLVDPERYRDRLETALTRATGWSAELGSIDLSVWRGLALSIAPVSLAAEGDGSSIEVERLDVRARLWPLLRGRLEITSIVLDRPALRFVRADERRGFSLPAIAGGADAGTAAATPAADLEVEIGEVRIRGGSLAVLDRAAAPPLAFDLTDVDATFEPATGALEARGRLADGGLLAIEGHPASRLDIEVSDLPTERLHAVVSPEVLHAGGTLSGTATLTDLRRIDAVVRARGVRLLAGEEPLDEADVTLTAQAAGGGWELAALDVRANGVGVTGSGPLTPALDVTLELGPAPLEAVLALSRSVLPLEFDVSGPGEVRATLRMTTERTNTTSLRANGELSAARFRLDESFPDATDVRAAFELTRDGALRIEILDGIVADGPLRGVARLDSVQPMGTMTIDGTLVDAGLGALIGPLVAGAAARLAGATAVDADMTVDLGRTTFDLRALGGRLGLDSRGVRLPGFDLDRAIRSAIEEKGGVVAALAGQLGDRAPTAGSASDEPLLDALDATIDFDTWPWRLERFAVRGGDMTADGSGTFDAESGALALALRAALSPARTEALVARNPGLRNLVAGDGRLTLPVTVGGSLTAPTVRVELGDLLRQRLEDKKDEAVKELLDRLRERGT